MENLLVHPFQNLLTEPNINRKKNINRITWHIHQVMSSDQNLALMGEIIKSGVEEVIKGFAKNKCLGLDGFTTELFQATWTIIGEDIVVVAEESICIKRMHLALNSNFQALIPKRDHSKDP